MRYEREAGENVLRLSKQLTPPGTEFQKHTKQTQIEGK